MKFLTLTVFPWTCFTQLFLYLHRRLDPGLDSPNALERLQREVSLGCCLIRAVDGLIVAGFTVSSLNFFWVDKEELLGQNFSHTHKLQVAS